VQLLELLHHPWFLLRKSLASPQVQQSIQRGVAGKGTGIAGSKGKSIGVAGSKGKSIGIA
jgi:hypothetical protein